MAEGDFTHTHIHMGRQSTEKMKQRETADAGLRDWSDEVTAKESQKPLDTRKGKERILPWSLQREAALPLDCWPPGLGEDKHLLVN